MKKISSPRRESGETKQITEGNTTNPKSYSGVGVLTFCPDKTRRSRQYVHLNEIKDSIFGHVLDGGKISELDFPAGRYRATTLKAMRQLSRIYPDTVTMVLDKGIWFLVLVSPVIQQ